MEENEEVGTLGVFAGIAGIFLFFGCTLWFVYSFIGNRAQHNLTKAIAFIVSLLLEINVCMWFFFHVMEKDKQPGKVVFHKDFIIGCSIAWVVLLFWAAWEDSRVPAEPE
jgi:hypothetical protein